MRNFLIAFTIFLVWSFFGLWLYSSFKTDIQSSSANTEIAENTNSDLKLIDPEGIDKLSEEPVNKSSIEDSFGKTKNYFDNIDSKLDGLKGINLDGDIIFLFGEGVSIIKNSSEIFIPESILDFKYKTKTYLLEHSNKEVHINSLYSASENSESPNLGIRRGQKVKEVLLSAEIPIEKIVIKSVIKDIEFNEEGIFSNSISIRFKELDENRIEQLKTELPKPINVYPKFSHSGILVNQDLKNLLAELKLIVKERPEIRVELIGHTDQIGSKIDNFKTGFNYAKQVENYLISKGGIEKSKIKSSSKGETEPLEPIDNIKNIMANRRITVVFY
ncbi:MAG: OOP family OmpA-OmpF porin [Ulvibacter sp.]|jgi:OOP family OmpA-OmpF porin